MIEGAQRISVRLYNNKTYQAKLVGTDPKTDLALLKIESPQPLPFVPWGVSEDAKIGEWIIDVYKRQVLAWPVQPPANFHVLGGCFWIGRPIAIRQGHKTHFP